MVVEEKRTLLVDSIVNGTVIDHITAKMALKMIPHLQLYRQKGSVFIGTHLPSTLLGTKDVLKVEGSKLTNQQTEIVALFSPQATVNLIKDHTVIEKYRVKLPEEIIGIVSCSNPRCITQQEKVSKRFYTMLHRKQVYFQCYYCDHTFTEGQL